MSTVGRQTWTVKEIAERWNCSTAHVLTLVHRGHLRAFDIGATKGKGKRTKYLVRDDDLVSFEEEREVAQLLPEDRPVRTHRFHVGDVIEFFSK